MSAWLEHFSTEFSAICLWLPDIDLQHLFLIDVFVFCQYILEPCAGLQPTPICVLCLVSVLTNVWILNLLRSWSCTYQCIDHVPNNLRIPQDLGPTYVRILDLLMSGSSACQCQDPEPSHIWILNLTMSGSWTFSCLDLVPTNVWILYLLMSGLCTHSYLDPVSTHTLDPVSY